MTASDPPPVMSEQARQRGRQLVLEVARTAPLPRAAPAEERFADHVARERVLDAHERELAQREQALQERRLLCLAAETALADRWQALVLRCHLLQVAQESLHGL